MFYINIQKIEKLTRKLNPLGKEPGKENAKKEKEVFPGPAHRSFDAGMYYQLEFKKNTRYIFLTLNSFLGAQNQPTAQKKKGFFKSFWKKSKHYSLDQ